MDYEKIILNMMERICTLEEQVRDLQKKSEKQVKKISTADIKEYILQLKENAKHNGESNLQLVANDLHKALALKSSMPMVCNAMKQAMGDKDTIIFQTESGYSSTLTIRYVL